MDPREFLRNHLSETSVCFLVGKNGAGKSRFLVELSKLLRVEKKPVFAISNTQYDRFVGKRGIKRISATWGRSLPAHLLKQAIEVAAKEGATRLHEISRVMAYCGYDERFAVSCKLGKAQRVIGNIRLSIPERRDDWSSFVTSLSEFLGRELATEAAEVSTFSDEEYRIFTSTLNYLIYAPDELEQVFDLRNDSFLSSKSFDFVQVVRYESLLRRLEFIRKLQVRLYLGKRLIDIEEASSGELSLIATLAFLTVALPETGAVLLIDEPENSLHPQWQKEYVAKLLGSLSYKNTSVVVATHAPLVVSGAMSSKEVSVRVFKTEEAKVELIPDTMERELSESLEETLWEVFETVTPKNHYVSETLVEELDRLSKGAASIEDVLATIDGMSMSSFDEEQKSFFESVKELATEIDQESQA